MTSELKVAVRALSLQLNALTPKRTRLRIPGWARTRTVMVTADMDAFLKCNARFERYMERLAAVQKSFATIRKACHACTAVDELPTTEEKQAYKAFFTAEKKQRARDKYAETAIAAGKTPRITVNYVTKIEHGRIRMMRMTAKSGDDASLRLAVAVGDSMITAEHMPRPERKPRRKSKAKGEAKASGEAEAKGETKALGAGSTSKSSRHRHTDSRADTSSDGECDSDLERKDGYKPPAIGRERKELAKGDAAPEASVEAAVQSPAVASTAMAAPAPLAERDEPDEQTASKKRKRHVPPGPTAFGGA